ncbi:transcriptional regulator, LacI family [Jatrophihabitans endophyticus]|uniref:Transcriptional regulator, LacI family n=1 Tax=Jatrophihabitans endophyticus TaxID=1206085 RepID=A0A1M5MV07_9ACTN|nr:LacI family DNA-binding transcriptional regulator [Jatrophihabitans endophyticus]SHG81017.1 transcriptional regulator, LacI family [Jatrophihabitans endophyticus]
MHATVVRYRGVEAMVASIEDVARRAGVSIATVSRALRGLPDVATATRDRVLAAAAELDYVASPFAARLASGRTTTVGLVVPFVNRWFFSEVIATVENALRRENFDLLLYNLGDPSGRDRFFDVMPMRKRVDGVIVASLVLDDAEFAALEDLDLPVGLLGIERRGTLSAGIDDIAAACDAVTYLTSLGHRRVGLIGGDTDDPMRFTPPLHRRTGYHRALAAVGVEPDPALEQLGFFTVEGGIEAAQRLLAVPEPPTALFAESDEMAYGALRAIHDRGLRVPEDISVVGFDDQPFSDLMDLTTVRQPVAEQALDITTRLLNLIADSDGGVARDPSVTLPTELVVRNSTRAPGDGPGGSA